MLLIGGPSGVGKTTAAAQVARRLGATWLGVDDLRLALERTGVQVPDSRLAAAFDAPGGLVTVGELLSPAIEVVTENHVDQRMPLVIEGDGILPSLLDRPSVRERAIDGRARAVFLFEADAAALGDNLRARGPRNRVEQLARAEDLRAHARKNDLFGKWLRLEAERRRLSTVPSRPWETLVDRILAVARSH